MAAPPPRGMEVVPLAERMVAPLHLQHQHQHQHHLQLQESQQQQQQQQQQTPPDSSSQQQQQQLTQSAHGRGHQPGGSTCKECGNQAKKDCSFQRCRTCCKSRAYDCATHVRSTWVPAAKRRERQAIEAAAIAAGQPRPRAKRTRSISAAGISSAAGAGGGTMGPSFAIAPPPLLLPPAGGGGGGGSASPRSSDFAGYRGGGILPPEVRATAVFKCVRVTGIEDGENEYAYQASVKIGGHVFKGVLYDQGVETSATATTPVASLADLQLGAARSSSLPPTTSAYIDPSQLYGSATLLGALR